MEKLFQNESIIEERDELLVSPTGSLKTHRKAHFLKPILPPKSSQKLFKLPYVKPKPKWPLQVTFNGWPDAVEKRWKIWVKTMHSKYSLVWEKTGILEPIMCSTLKIRKNEALLFSLVENWCPDTNTFMFAWGEATVTLEDVMVLGGYSVLGDPVLFEYEKDDKLVEIRGFLEKGRKNVKGLKKDEFNVDWLYFFMDRGCAFEHEAFLCLWLLAFVFPGCDENVFGVVVDLAVWLGRGRRFALGPCVLASLYRDLGVLRGAMVELDDDDGLEFTLWSPLYLVQVWAWERFTLLQPKPNVVGRGDVRMKRWHGEKNGSVSESGFSSSGVSFLWRPFAIAVEGLSLPKFYVEKEVVLRREEMSLEFESFFRCLRACVLVGVDCQEQYSPHRVAMQFGFDQDIPVRLPRENVSREIGWYAYGKPLSDDEVLYFPSRLFESDVSDAYSKWWRKSVLCPEIRFKDVVTGMRSDRKRREFTLNYRKKGLYSDALKNFVLQGPGIKTESSINGCEIGKPNPQNDLDVPPGFEHVKAVRADVAPGFGHVRVSRFRSVNDLVSVAKSNELVVDAPPGFEPIRAAKEESISEKCVDDTLPGIGLSTKSTVGKRKEKSVSEFPDKSRLAIRNEKLFHKSVSKPDTGFRRFAPANPKQIVGSITGVDYRNYTLNRGGSVIKESERLADGSSSNFDVESVSDIEAHISGIEGEVAALKRCKRRKRSDVSGIEKRVASIKTRVSKIEKELVALKNGCLRKSRR